jgi:fibronectin type 3 domain-containing protein
LGDSGLGDSGLGIELDYETASDGSAPNSLTATAGKQSITLNWNASNVTTAVKYSIYRAINAISPTNLPTLIGTVVGAPPLTTFVDNDVKNNVTYSYVVVMTDSKATQSGPSNAVTIKK